MTPSGADRPKGLVCSALLDPPHPTSSIPPLLPQALLLWGRVQQEMSFLHCGFPISRAGWKGEEGDRSFPGTTDGVSVFCLSAPVLCACGVPRWKSSGSSIQYLRSQFSCLALGLGDSWC